MLPPDFTTSMAAFIWVSVHTFLLADRLDGDLKMAGADLDRFLLVSRFLCLVRGIPTIEGIKVITQKQLKCARDTTYLDLIAAENTTTPAQIGRKRM